MRAVFEGVVEYSFKQFTERKENQKVVKKGDGPLVNSNCAVFSVDFSVDFSCFSIQVEHKCANCGNEEMTYTTQQTRSVDEGQTVFYTCPKCRSLFNPFLCDIVNYSLYIARYQEVENS